MKRTMTLNSPRMTIVMKTDVLIINEYLSLEMNRLALMRFYC
jgi:hypothetical protein